MPYLKNKQFIISKKTKYKWTYKKIKRLIFIFVASLLSSIWTCLERFYWLVNSPCWTLFNIGHHQMMNHTLSRTLTLFSQKMNMHNCLGWNFFNASTTNILPRIIKTLFRRMSELIYQHDLEHELVFSNSSTASILPRIIKTLFLRMSSLMYQHN